MITSPKSLSKSRCKNGNDFEDQDTLNYEKFKNRRVLSKSSCCDVSTIQA